MQRSSSSSALSKISRAVFGVKHMDTVECSIFNFFIPLRDLEKNKLRKIQIQTSSSTMTECPAARGGVGCLHSNYFYFARLN